MRISYDAQYDLLYIQLGEGTPEVSTKQVDDDIALDFDDGGRLFGIEVLDASKHVDLARILPVTVAQSS